MIDESNNYQLGLDFFYRQNSDNFSYFRKHFLKQMTHESTQTDFSFLFHWKNHHHIIITLSSSWIVASRPSDGSKMVRIFARFVASPPSDGSKNGENSSLICGLNPLTARIFHLNFNKIGPIFSSKMGKFYLNLQNRRICRIEKCTIVLDGDVIITH